MKRAPKGTLCSLCGLPVDSKHHVYSHYTGLFYCSDLDNCHRRAKNNLTIEEAETLTNMVIEAIERGDIHNAATV